MTILQIFSYFSATLGAFSLGNALGWSSPTLTPLKRSMGLSDEDISWAASVMTLGAASANILVALLLDRIGRKWTMLLVACPWVMGWFLLAFPNTFTILVVARSITGFCGGVFCVSAPMYTAELSEKDIRGKLGVLFQFMLVSGILMVYVLGIFGSTKLVALPCVAVPILLAMILFFIPNSPVYHVQKRKEKLARKALKFFRGSQYNMEDELKEIAAFTKVGNEKVVHSF